MKRLSLLLIAMLLLLSLCACDSNAKEFGEENNITCNHDDPSQIIIVNSVLPTCQKTGLTEGKKCTICNTMLIHQEEIPAFGCIESDWIIDIEATHTIDGSMHKKCLICNRVIKNQIIHSGQKSMEYKLMTHDSTYQIKNIGFCTDKDIIIPSKYYEVPVTVIGYAAFRDCTMLESIFIPKSITSIYSYAFDGCSSLTSIYYEGTIEQWNEIGFAHTWYRDIPATEVICNDGTVPLK